MAGYTRQSSAEIADALTIEAVDLNNEFNDLVAAFSNTSGHKHDGTAAEGPVISVLGDAGVATPLNKILVDTTNKHIEFYTDVSSAAVQQLRIQDGAIVPILDNDIDIGTTALEFKDGFFDGTVNLDTLVIGTSTGVTSVDTDLTSASASDDTLASAKAIKTYVDAVPVGDLTAIVAGDGLTGTSLSGPIPTLNVIGGNGITANADELVIDTAITVDKTTAQILTNKTLTTPTIASILNTGTITLPTSTDTLVGKATTDVLTNKTLTSPVLNIGISGTAFKDEDTMSSDSATAVSSQQSIKAYVDTQVATIPVGDITSVVAGTGLTGGATSGAATLNIDSSVVTLTDTQALSAKTLTSPVLNTGISGTAFLDEDDFASDSATKVASQQSVKAYVDGKSHLSLIDEDNFATDSATRPPSQQSVKAYVDGQTHLSLIDEDNMATDSATRPPSQQSVKAYVDGQASSVTASSTTTFTGKTIDANGTGNSITNLEVADLASGVLDTDITSVSGSDDTLASAKAIKTYVDAQTHLSLIDEDNFATDSATRPPSQQSVKAYVDGQTHLSLIDEDNMATDSATRPPSQQSVKAYVDGQTHDSGIDDIVEDTTPSLGGDLNLNGNNIDFPTTANISDCLDEDTMSSNSATKLATQQSIKAYVDAQSHLSLIDEDNFATDSATRPPSQQSVKAYADTKASTGDATSLAIALG